MNIQYITYQEINKEKWNECITSSINHLVYAEFWYLDVVCEQNWSALVLDDYKAVMPLPLKSKMGLTYVQQPIWTQQLGVFSIKEISTDLINLFLEKIPKKMALVSLNLGETNFSDNHQFNSKTNLILNLNKPFNQLQSSFSSNTKRNCKKAHKGNLNIEFGSENLNEFIHFFKENIQNPISKFHYSSLEQLIIESIKQQKGFITLVKHENKIVAASFILKSENRLIYRTGTSSEKGKELKAMFFLVESILKKYQTKEYILDFEGSEIKGVARFYKNFGAQNVPYYYYKKYNNKLLKFVKE